MQRTHTSELSLQRGEGAGEFIRQFPSITGGGPSPKLLIPCTSGLPHSGKVGCSAQRLPSGKAREALVIRSLRGVSGQDEGMWTGHRKHRVYDRGVLLEGEIRSYMKSG